MTLFEWALIVAIVATVTVTVTAVLVLLLLIGEQRRARRSRHDLRERLYRLRKELREQQDEAQATDAGLS